MAVHPHPTGRYRAYRKVNGVEYQEYYRTKEEADKAQARLDKMADEFYALQASKVFSDCGRLINFRFYTRHREGRESAIIMNFQRKADGKLIGSNELRYKGNFEALWRETLEKWKEVNGLLPQDIAHYLPQIKKAKRLYLQDLSERLEQLEQVA